MSTARTLASRPAYGEELADEIISRYGRDRRSPSGRLPTERQLAAELGVTRTMVRNALSLLEARGWVSREVGRGTFLRSTRALQSGSTLEERTSEHVGPADVMAARRILEPTVLPLVVAWATQKDFEEMQRCLDGGAGAEHASAFEVWDFALHHAIVAASRNALVLSMYAVVENARKGELWGNLKRRSDSRERRAAYQDDHVALVAALRARELARALDVMDAHLRRVEANLLGAAER